ncbi:hypothetical protein [Streptomyces fructofermentans]|uniref:Uncharacterized protein n=1 Tax=Streptomyces fructofermentans TaxID=152141 RepID=A0A918KHV1_9ACTN|nr:hypothetical protein [Streptomyces fructofermentans]GGX63892.1 hypothetical protein GCM10010515_34510 [Streptomyces fructofermentans]
MTGTATFEIRKSAPPDVTRTAEDPLSWRGLGLDSLAGMLVLSLRRLGNRSFEADCQWPRLHPLNERDLAVTHHPLIMAESTRQIAAALRGRRMPPTARGCEPVGVRLGLDPGSRPVERGAATDVPARVTVSDMEVRAGELVSFRVTAEYLYAGQVFGTCALLFAEVRTIDGDRTAGLPRPPGLLHPAAAAVGAAAEPDVMLARAAQGRLVILPRDPGHPFFLAGRPRCLPVLAVAEAGRQAALLRHGGTASSVMGLSVQLGAPVPLSGAALEVDAEPGGARFVVLAEGRPVASGSVTVPLP